MSTEPVLIIGAGLGGLCLAQSLHKRGVNYRIFERDDQNGSRAQGWAISLKPQMIADLCSSVRDDEKALRAMCPTASLDLPSEGIIYSCTDGQRKQLFRFGEGTEMPFVRIERPKLREWLLKDITIEWGKKFQSYEEDADGVTAHFADGTTARGSVLVGADGISSRVRRQLLSGTEPELLPVGFVLGEVTATRAQYEKWLKFAHSISVVFIGSRRISMCVKSVAEDKNSARFYWLFGWGDDKATEPHYWTTKASQEELHSFVMKNLDGLDEEYAEAMRVTPVEGMLHPPLQMRDMIPPTLPKGRVTLMGDAVHSMVPFRGEGGNMAMKDGMVLAGLLAQIDHQQQVADVLKEYEKEMSERAGHSVRLSRETTFMRAGMFDKK